MTCRIKKQIQIFHPHSSRIAYNVLLCEFQGNTVKQVFELGSASKNYTKCI